MSFERKLKRALEEIPVPDELSPENIEAMLAGLGTANPDIHDNTVSRSRKVKDINADRKHIQISASRTNRSVIMRTAAAAAACVALAAGFTAIRKENAAPVEIEEEKTYEAVQVRSYDELYNIYTGIYLNSPADNPPVTGAENGDGVEIPTDPDETAITESTVVSTPETVPVITSAEPPPRTEIPEKTLEAVRSDFSDADIVKSDDKSIYYICGGTLYVVSKDDMAVTAEISGENAPFEMYVRGNSLVLISEDRNSSSEDGTERENVAVDIYDISSGLPDHIRTYKQNGMYTSARIDDSGVLYLITGYSDYRAAPLDNNASLENYVPGYYIDGEKRFVAAEDIIVPPGANNTDYTVISAMGCYDGGNVSVKAVLGSNANAYCSDSTLYVASEGVRNGRDYTAVTSFAVSGSGLEYKSNCAVDGQLISRYSMCEYEGGFRIACRDFNENGMITTNIYTLNSNLQTVSSTLGLLPGVIAGSVKFEGNYASIYERDHSEPIQLVDLTQSSPVGESVTAGYMAPYVNSFSDSYMVGITACEDECGSACALKLELYDSQTGDKINEITFAEFPGAASPALIDKKAMLCDYAHNVIGIPVSSVNEFGVKNQYYVFGCNGNGFYERGVFEYNDIDDSYRFDRAVINDGMLYIIGSGRMVSVSLDDMTVTEEFDF